MRGWEVLTFTFKVQRRPLSVDAFAVFAAPRLDVSDLADVMDAVSGSEALHGDEPVGEVGVFDGCWDAAPYCGSDNKSFD